MGEEFAASLHKVADDTLSKIRQVRTTLEYEICRAESDELVMAERSNEMDALGNQLAVFLQTQIQSDPTAFNFVDLHTQLQTSITKLEHEVSRSKETFIRGLVNCLTFSNPERMRLVEKQTINCRVVLPTDKNKLPKVKGVALKEHTDIIYFTDENNPSKIKLLNLKTNQVGEVHNKYLIEISCVHTVRVFYTRNVNRAEISGPARKLFCPARNQYIAKFEQLF